MKGCITKYWTWEGGTGSDKVRSSPQVLDDRSGIPGFQATSSRTQPFPSHWPLPLTHIPLVSTHRSGKSTSWGSSEIRSSGAKLSANVSRLESSSQSGSKSPQKQVGARTPRCTDQLDFEIWKEGEELQRGVMEGLLPSLPGGRRASVASNSALRGEKGPRKEGEERREGGREEREGR